MVRFGNNNNFMPIRVSIDEFIEDVIESHSLGPFGEPRYSCNKCNALKFKGEPKGFCCVKGKVVLDLPPELPPIISRLFDDDNFRKKTRKYNQSFAFTSLGSTTVDRRYADERQGVYTFRISGNLHHLIGTQMIPRDQNKQYFQIYFSDTEEQMGRRQQIFNNEFNRDALLTLTQAINDINPHVQLLKTAYQMDDVHEKKIVFHANGVGNRPPPVGHDERYICYIGLISFFLLK